MRIAQVFVVAAMLIGFVASYGTTSQAAESEEAEAKSVARLVAASEYYMKKASPDKALTYLKSLYLLLKGREAAEGKAYADRLFYVGTGITTDRTSYFKLMGVIDRDGRLLEIPREPEERSFTCSQHWSGEVSCHGN